MVLKKGSKQVTLKHKYALQKKANHHRKLRRLAKKAGLKKPKKEKPVELTIPKSWVHKEAMLKAILEERQHAEERRTKARKTAKERKKAKKQAKTAPQDSDEEL